MKNTSVLFAVTLLGSIVLALLPPLVLESMIDTLSAGEPVSFSMAIGYFVIVALSGLFDAGKACMITILGQRITHQLRQKMSSKLTRLSASYFVEQEPGVTASRFVNDVNTIESLFSAGIVSMLADVCKLLGILAVIYIKSPGLGMLLTVTAPFIFWLTRIFQKKTLTAQMENRVAIGHTNQQIPESLRNIRTIRTLHQEAYMISRYETAIDQSYQAQERSNFYDAIYSPIIVSVSAWLVGIMMALSAQNGLFQTFFGMSAGTAAAVIAYAGSFFQPLESIGMEIQNIQTAASGIRRIKEFLEEPEQENCDKQTVDTSAAVVLRDVSFRYQAEKADILHQFSFSLKEGETVILEGRTGAGKSTVVKLIAGLYQPQKGEVFVFGRDPMTIPETEKRKWYGYVEQKFQPVLGTVAEQISLHDTQITPEQIRQALCIVGLWEVIEKLPLGLDTPYSEELLSQGQCQLLSIARAIVSEPKLLLLDEITAHLDAQTEQMVLKALREAAKGRSVVSVSHRIYEDMQEKGARVVIIGQEIK